jgi:signal transduction histidine kinase
VSNPKAGSGENELERYAALGRFMVRVRHDMNNALTAVLGNSELLLESPDLSAQAREQLQSVHAMAVRVQEIMREFSALDRELRLEGAAQEEKQTYVSGK